MLLASYNIHYGVGRDGRLDLERTIREVATADVIALQEVDANWDRSENQVQPTVIAQMLPEHEIAWGPTVDAWKTGSRLRRQFGNLIASRYPIVSIRNYLLPKYGAADYLDIQKGALEVVLDSPIGVVRVYSTHLCSTSAAQRRLQLDWLLDQHRRAADEGPVLYGRHPDATWTSEPALPDMPRDAIMMGDFNFGDETEAYATIAGEHSTRFGHLTRRGGFVDAWAATNRDASATNGLPGATVLGAKEERVDYCLVTQPLAARLERAWVDVVAEGSDHQPLFVALRP